MNLEKYKKEFSDYKDRLIKTIIVWMINRNKGDSIDVYDPEYNNIKLTENSLDVLIQINLDSVIRNSIKTSGYLEIYDILNSLSKYSGERVLFTSLLGELKSLIDSLIRDYFLAIKSCKDPESFIKKTLLQFNCMKDSKKGRYPLDHIDYEKKIIYFSGIPEIHVDINEIDTILENI